jgi:hypothetical protein
MNHSKLTTGLALTIATLACAGSAAAQSCAERATRLKTEIDALPSSSSSRTALSESLGIAMGSDAVRCGEILAGVEKELAAASERTAAAEKPVPNHPTFPAGPATAPELDAAAPDASNEKGQASGDEPIPGPVSGNAPPATGADGIASTADAIVEQGESAQASGDDPIPTQTNADDGEAPPED